MPLHTLLAQVEVPPVPPLPPVGQAPTPPPDIPPEVFALLASIPPQVFVLVILGVLAIGGSVIFLLVRAIARRLEGGANIRELRAEVERLRERVAEVDSAHIRLAELEERLEFSERLLAQQAGGYHEERGR